ncbi:hypothetical protein OsJ_32498 [Oryza sativa Japonica Group]|uniref:Uncharacterized protein n=1 Tax=Oryza sativa subsp. japonica TaxID=39947 RepID=B9G723_ORYSJ|nr:hypothetical protein OsJ_32498 [Oryza sativa Japonica Group]
MRAAAVPQPPAYACRFRSPLPGSARLSPRPQLATVPASACRSRRSPLASTRDPPSASARRLRSPPPVASAQPASSASPPLAAVRRLAATAICSSLHRTLVARRPPSPHRRRGCGKKAVDCSPGGGREM